MMSVDAWFGSLLLVKVAGLVTPLLIAIPSPATFVPWPFSAPEQRETPVFVQSVS